MSLDERIFAVYDTCLDSMDLVAVYDNYLDAEIRATQYGYKIYEYTFSKELKYNRE